MKIAVVGTGYVGLVTATCFAELGHSVVGVDIDAGKIERLQRGESVIHELGLEDLIKRGIKSKLLSFTTDLLATLPDVEMVFCAVATPPGEGFKADLRAVFSVCDTVAEHAEKPVIFVNKSTVPVGTGLLCEERIAKLLKKRGKTFAIPVVSNPEFLREGMAVSDTLMPDRVVVGLDGDGKEVRAKMEELYRPITRVGRPLVFMSRESAEIVKYASNAYLATRISFVNMLSLFAEKTGGNIRDISNAMGLDNRIGPRFLHAGIGYGGSCFPKDIKAFLSTAKEYGVPLEIIEATDRINAEQRMRFFQKIIDGLDAKAKVGIWGLSFKPGTDDMRDAPSLDFIPMLLKHQCVVSAFDPSAMNNAKKLLPADVQFASSPFEAAQDADVVVLLTEWDTFRGIDFKKLKSLMKGQIFYDGRNVYEPKEVEASGLQYRTIGLSSHC